MEAKHLLRTLPLWMTVVLLLDVAAVTTIRQGGQDVPAPVSYNTIFLLVAGTVAVLLLPTAGRLNQPGSGAKGALVGLTAMYLPFLVWLQLNPPLRVWVLDYDRGDTPSLHDIAGPAWYQSARTTVVILAAAAHLGGMTLAPRPEPRLGRI